MPGSQACRRRLAYRQSQMSHRPNNQPCAICHTPVPRLTPSNSATRSPSKASCCTVPRSTARPSASFRLINDTHLLHQRRKNRTSEAVSTTSGRRVQCGKHVEVSVGVLDLGAMMPSASMDQDVGRWDCLPGAPRPARKVKRRLPHVVVDREVWKHGLILPQGTSFPIVADARPYLQANHGAPRGLTRLQKRLHASAHQRVALRSHLMNPRRSVNKLHLRTHP